MYILCIGIGKKFLNKRQCLSLRPVLSVRQVRAGESSLRSAFPLQLVDEMRLRWAFIR